jgi:two-component system LytT family response regulator
MNRGSTLDALVVDDEPFARSGLRMLLEDDEDITSIREAASGRAAIDAMAARRPDLVLLDVQMPGMTGFDVVDAVGVASMPGVVFVTAHDRYAVRAFEVNAIDYLLKPVTASRFSEAMARAKARLRTEDAQSAQLSGLLRTVAAPNQYVTRLAARDGGGRHTGSNDKEIGKKDENRTMSMVAVSALVHRVSRAPFPAMSAICASQMAATPRNE